MVLFLAVAQSETMGLADCHADRRCSFYTMSTLENKKSRLMELLRSRSVFYGDFTLSSGARSRYYFDCKLTTLHGEAASLIGSIVHGMIREQEALRNVQIDGIGGLTMGADPIALATGIASFHEHLERPLNVFIVRKTQKAHGQGKQIEGNFKAGDRVVVIDDVVTKGEATVQAIDAVEAQGGKVEFVIMLVDREEGGRARIEARGIPTFPIFRKSELLVGEP
jgi:orotate phosphoribosyltransferase